MKRLSLMAAVLLVAAAAVLSAFPQAKTVKTHLKVGDTAPDFTLPDQNNKPVKLSDFRGKQNVVLAFYVLAFTGG
jgi:cytochrome oxidase Cu insertion factor (SCO1/SenC/PrrC family)